MASVLVREPNLALLPADTPESFADCCVGASEGAAERLHDIGDARIEIQDAQAKADPDVIARSGSGRQSPRPCAPRVDRGRAAGDGLDCRGGGGDRTRPPSTAGRTARCAGNHHATDHGSGVAGIVARRARSCVRRRFGTASRVCGCARWRRSRHDRWPEPRERRIPSGRRTAARSGSLPRANSSGSTSPGWDCANPGERVHRPGWHVEPRWRHPVCPDHVRPTLPGLRHGG